MNGTIAKCNLLYSNLGYRIIRLATNLGVGSSNLSGRAKLKALMDIDYY